MDEQTKGFIETRRRILTDFMRTGDLGNVYVLCQVHHIPIPPTVDALKLSIYETILCNPEFDDETKKMARTRVKVRLKC